MNENIKLIYTFSVNQTVESQENGETVKVKKPIYFGIKKPSRSEKEEAELVRSEYLSKYIRRGVLPEAILSKTYDNQGGTVTENERASLIVLQLQLIEKQEEYKKLGVDKAPKETLDKVASEIASIYNEVAEIQFKHSMFYENTAEFKAKTKMISYLAGVLTYFRKDESSEWERYFESDVLDEILDKSDDLEEKGDEVYMKAKDKILFAVSFYVQNPSVADSKEISEKIKDYGLSDD
jgi:hypothetical protein